MTDRVLSILIVDDEAPARTRLTDLLGDIAASQPNRVAGQAANGQEALKRLEEAPVDVALVDIRMPGMDGMEFARHAARLPHPPLVIFTTAYDEYAVQAFDLEAIDYLLKPVRASRLEAALAKARRALPANQPVLQGLAPSGGRSHFSVTERGRILLIPVAEVLYLKAEQKYVTARTADREYLLDESLVQLEEEFAGRFIRIHRNCLVAREAITGFERLSMEEGSEAHWAVCLAGVPERLPVSRRQWAVVKEVAAL